MIPGYNYGSREFESGIDIFSVFEPADDGHVVWELSAVPMMGSAIFSINDPQGRRLPIIKCVHEKLVESTFNVRELILARFASVVKLFESDLHLIANIFGCIVP